ncbi:site-specific DNA-methyltransferase [Tistrella mobilis]|uniref:site-specific DNA-methyltransferase n=1 Tax=Tistrella mobilis TaxID=171437 RepID=UPI003556946A
MAAKAKLELTWIGKDIRPRLEPRILIEEPELSYHAKARRDGDIFDNLLIHGDNLLALKALETDPAIRGKVKCIYIDPPYNTGSAIPEYDDGIEHSIWLGLIRERLEILKELLHPIGTIWLNIDDNEGHYLKVLSDEVFGRRNFVTTVIWQKKYGPKADTRFISSSHDMILVYAKDIEKAKIKRLPKGEKQNSRYVNKDNDPRGPWKAGDVLRNEVRDYAVFPVRLPSGREVMPSPGTSWRYTKEKFQEMIADNRIWFGVDGDARPAVKRFLSEVSDTIPAESIWPYHAVGHNDEAKKESKALFGGAVFTTPKPERLIQRILEITSDPGDLVLDSFAGSGTTGAVAHKMGRRWIMVELGDHAKTHIVPRLQKVIDGTDKGGVTESTGWKGGGGYRFARLAPSLLEKDAWGNWVIRKEYNPAMLAEAMCKHFNYTYAPSTEHFWMHGHSSETSYIYVTTNSLTGEQLRALSEEVGEHRSLLICCKAFEEQSARALNNLTIRKIPGAVLDRCEWGKDDYSLKISALPMMQEDDEDDVPLATRRNGKKDASTGDLFADDGEV